MKRVEENVRETFKSIILGTLGSCAIQQCLDSFAGRAGCGGKDKFTKRVFDSVWTFIAVSNKAVDLRVCLLRSLLVLYQFCTNYSRHII